MGNRVGRYSVKDAINRCLGGEASNESNNLGLRTNLYLKQESLTVTPGASADGYDVKNTGGGFANVTFSYNLEITNNDSAETITIYLNEDNTYPMDIPAGDSRVINNFEVTNVYIDTTAGQTGTVTLIMFGE